ncbi:MAG: hypothetical protein IKN63_01660 [Bacilli bacterium]|nr:hypothetical protein [Bacilli bacterium]
MKKRIFKFFLLLVILFSVTGCIKYNTLMEIKEDKSMNFSIIYAISKSIFEMGEEASDKLLTSDQKQELIKQGFKVEDYLDDNFQGFQISKKIDNIDNVSIESDVIYSLSKIPENSNTKMFKVIKDTDKNIYTANFTFNANDSDIKNINQETNENSTIDLSGLDEEIKNSLDLKYVVKLPYAAISSNATSKSEDNRELTWNLSSDNIETIRFQFELKNSKENIVSTSNIIIIIPIIIVLLIIVMIIVLLIKKRENKKNNVVNLDIPVVPAELTSTISQTKTGDEQSVNSSDEKITIQVLPVNLNEQKENIDTSTELKTDISTENNNSINQFEIGNQNISTNDNLINKDSKDLLSNNSENINNQNINKSNNNETPLI